jgi:hypothetical protein
VQQKQCRPLSSFVLINIKAPNIHAHVTTFFTALEPRTEHWFRALQTLKQPLIVVDMFSQFASVSFGSFKDFCIWALRNLRV